MSLGKLSDAGHLGEEFKGFTIADYLEAIEKQFYKAYGRYENASGKMYIELEHNGADGDHEQGSVKWRKGITDGEVLEDVILERKEALPRFAKSIHKGYYLVFSAITASDFERERAKQLESFSAMKREGILGAYHRGDKEVFRVNEYEGVYSVERLYSGMITAGRHQLTEEEARAALAEALAEGFHREGEAEPESNIDPFAAWRNHSEVLDEDAEAPSGEPSNVPDMSELLKAFGG